MTVIVVYFGSGFMKPKCRYSHIPSELVEDKTFISRLGRWNKFHFTLGIITLFLGMGLNGNGFTLFSQKYDWENQNPKYLVLIVLSTASAIVLKFWLFIIIIYIHNF